MVPPRFSLQTSVSNPISSSSSTHSTPNNPPRSVPKPTKKKLKQSKLPQNFVASASVSYGKRRPSETRPGRSSSTILRSVSQERLLEDTSSRSAPTIKLADQQMQRMRQILAADSLALQAVSPQLQNQISPLNNPLPPPEPGPSKLPDNHHQNHSRPLLSPSHFSPTLLFQKNNPSNHSTHPDPDPDQLEPASRRRGERPDYSTPLISHPDPSSSPLPSHTTPVRPVQETFYPLGIDIETQCSPLTYQLVHPPEKIRQLNRSHGGWLEHKANTSKNLKRPDDRHGNNGSKTLARIDSNKNEHTNTNSRPRPKQHATFNPPNTKNAQGTLKKTRDSPLAPVASNKSRPHTDPQAQEMTGAQSLNPKVSVPTQTSIEAKSVGYHPPTDVQISSPAKSSTSIIEELSETDYESDVEPGLEVRALCPNSSSSLSTRPDQVPVQPDCFELEPESMVPESQNRWSDSRLMFVEDVLEVGAVRIEESMLPETQKPRRECLMLFDEERIGVDQSSMVDLAGQEFRQGIRHQVRDSSSELADVTLQAEMGDERPVLTSTPTRSRVLVEETQVSDSDSPTRTSRILAEESQESPRRLGLGRSLAPPTPVPVRVKRLEKFQSGSGRRLSTVGSARNSQQAVSVLPPPQPTLEREEHLRGGELAGGKVIPRKRPASSMVTRIKNAWTTAPEFRIPSAPSLRQVGIAQFCVSNGVSSSMTAAGRAVEVAGCEERAERVRALALVAEESLRRMTSGRGEGVEVRDDGLGSEEDEIVDGEAEAGEVIPGSDETEVGSEALDLALKELVKRKQMRLGLAEELNQRELRIGKNEWLLQEDKWDDDKCQSEVARAVDEVVDEVLSDGGGGIGGREGICASGLVGLVGWEHEQQEEEEELQEEVDDDEVDVSTQKLIEISEALLQQQQEEEEEVEE